jgi:hypothetical protein
LSIQVTQCPLGCITRKKDSNGLCANPPDDQGSFRHNEQSEKISAMQILLYHRVMHDLFPKTCWHTQVAVRDCAFLISNSSGRLLLLAVYGSRIRGHRVVHSTMVSEHPLEYQINFIGVLTRNSSLRSQQQFLTSSSTLHFPPKPSTSAHRFSAKSYPHHATLSPTPHYSPFDAQMNDKPDTARQPYSVCALHANPASILLYVLLWE